jgi:general stress protein 26
MTLVIPEATRPKMKDYGISTKPDGLIKWQWVSDELVKSRNYWICTTSPDNRPHAAPVWGVAYEDLVYFGTGKSSRKARNFLERPDVVLHLESGENCVIVEGRVEIVTDMALIQTLAPLYGAKYAPFKPTAKELAEGGLYTVQPKVVMAWTESDFPNTATKWVFKK